LYLLHNGLTSLFWLQDYLIEKKNSLPKHYPILIVLLVTQEMPWPNNFSNLSTNFKLMMEIELQHVWTRVTKTSRRLTAGPLTTLVDDIYIVSVSIGDWVRGEMVLYANADARVLTLSLQEASTIRQDN